MAEASGLVSERKILKLDLHGGLLALEKGGTLREVQVAYETWGERRGNNVVYVCHALTGDSHVTGRLADGSQVEGWWENYVGPGKPIDTDRYFIVCSNILGGCMGTTGPASTDPETGRAYGVDFPEITLRDITEVQRRLLTQLGVDHAYAVVGGSLGAMNTLQWAVSHPGFVDKVICIAGTKSLSAMNLAFDVVGREMILRDPGWSGGHYHGTERRPDNGLAVARMLAHITYLSEKAMERKFGREEKTVAPATIFHTAFQVESYLHHQGSKFVDRFDANSYLYITKAMDEFDITAGIRPPHRVFEPSTADFLVVGLSSDWLFPPDESREIAEILLRAGKNVTFCEIDCEHGHDAFLMENPHLMALLSTFLEGHDSRHPEPVATVSGDAASRALAARTEAVIQTLLPAQGRIIDLGCGTGDLLHTYSEASDSDAQGIDIDVANVLECNRRQIPVFQTDLDEGLSMIPDDFYDVAVLSSTLQQVVRPHAVVREMLRVAKRGIVSFPNMAHWHNRLQLFLFGRVPVSPALAHTWYDTPNLHFLSLSDFTAFCRSEGIRVKAAHALGYGLISSILTAIGLKNIGGDVVVVEIERP
ncbi:MAG: homoserine O-acetyltransferase [Spirochaetes bacterium]|nr:homoserine O-acetyltransferase [Spirochaetota bacterium]